MIWTVDKYCWFGSLNKNNASAAPFFPSSTRCSRRVFLAATMAISYIAKIALKKNKISIISTLPKTDIISCDPSHAFDLTFTIKNLNESPEKTPKKGERVF